MVNSPRGFNQTRCYQESKMASYQASLDRRSLSTTPRSTTNSGLNYKVVAAGKPFTITKAMATMAQESRERMDVSGVLQPG